MAITEADIEREQDVELAERFLEEAQVVAHVLGRSIDFVRDTGGKLADGFELLGLAKIVLKAIALLECLLEHGDVGDAAFPAGEFLVGVEQRCRVDEHVQLVALGILN